MLKGEKKQPYKPTQAILEYGAAFNDKGELNIE